MGAEQVRVRSGGEGDGQEADAEVPGSFCYVSELAKVSWELGHGALSGIAGGATRAIPKLSPAGIRAEADAALDEGMKLEDA